MSDEEKKENGEKQGDEGNGKKRKMLGLEPIETQHELALEDRTLNYTARAGAIPLQDDKGETEAEIFFVAYDLEGGEDRSERPLTFVFNGGPGSSTIWLHIGALGPKRVRMEAEGWMPHRIHDHAHEHRP